MLATQYGNDTLFRSLEITAEDFTTQVGSCEVGFSCAYLNTISWRTPTQPLPMELNPRLVFERMFGGGLGSPEQRAARLRNRRSVLDMVAGEARQLQGRLTPADRGRMDDYLQNVREIELRLERTEQQNAVSVGAPATRRSACPDDYADHVGLMFDLMAVAFQADITRVFTFMMGRELSSRTYPQLGISEPHHAVSHHQNKPERIEKYATTNAYHAQLVAKYLARLKATPEGDGTLLDHSLLLWGSGMSNPNIHSFDPLPVVLLGGDSGHLKGGRHVVAKEGTPMANLLLSLAQQRRRRAGTVRRQHRHGEPVEPEGRAMSHTAVVGRAVAMLLVVSAPVARGPEAGVWRHRGTVRGRNDVDAAGVTRAAPCRRVRRRHRRRTADPRRRGRQRDDPLSRDAAVDRGAARQRRHRRQLLKAGANPNAVMGEGEPVIMTAARTGNVDAAEGAASRPARTSMPGSGSTARRR